MKYIYGFLIAAGVLFSHESMDIELKEDSVCVVFVCDGNYMHKFKKTYLQLRGDGCYDGEVCLILTGDYDKDSCYLDFFEDPKNHIVTFPEIIVPERVKKCAYRPKCVQAQMQKFHIFNVYFKSWDYILYIDCGMNVHGDVNKIIATREKGIYLAPGDLNIKDHTPQKHSVDFGPKDESFRHLKKRFGLEYVYPRSGVMLFDTDVIKVDTVSDMKRLLYTYPCGKGDQSYIALYFVHINPVWKPLLREDENQDYYDFCPRGEGRVYIMHKYHMLPYAAPIKCPLCKEDEGNLIS